MTMSAADETRSPTTSSVVVNNMGYLVHEVYTPFIIEHVHFSLLAETMPCMRQVMVEIMDKEQNGDKEGAARVFLQRLKETDEAGKYQNFLEALDHANYPMIANILRDMDGNSELHESQEIIHLFHSPITDSIDPIVISQSLLQEGIITSDEGELISNIARKDGFKLANFKLLNCMIHHKSNWYHVFLTQLLENGYKNLVETLDPKFYANAHKTSETSDIHEYEEEEQLSIESVTVSHTPPAASQIQPVASRQESLLASGHGPGSQDVDRGDGEGLNAVLRELRELRQMQQQQLDMLGRLDNRVAGLSERVDGLAILVHNIQATGSSS